MVRPIPFLGIGLRYTWSFLTMAKFWVPHGEKDILWDLWNVLGIVFFGSFTHFKNGAGAGFWWFLFCFNRFPSPWYHPAKIRWIYGRRSVGDWVRYLAPISQSYIAMYQNSWFLKTYSWTRTLSEPFKSFPHSTFKVQATDTEKHMKKTPVCCQDITWDLIPTVVVLKLGSSNFLWGKWPSCTSPLAWHMAPKAPLKKGCRRTRIWCTKWKSWTWNRNWSWLSETHRVNNYCMWTKMHPLSIVK